MRRKAIKSAAIVGACATTAMLIGCNCCCTYLWGGIGAAIAAALGLTGQLGLPF